MKPTISLAATPDEELQLAHAHIVAELQKRGCSNGTDSEFGDDSSEDGIQSCACAGWGRVTLHMLLFLLGLAAIVLLIMKYVLPHSVSWQVVDLKLTGLELPDFLDMGIQPADTSTCPVVDPCGTGSARGCSKCPLQGMWDEGCICRSTSVDKPGVVMKSNTSMCPWTDPCGVGLSKGCSTCPDGSWINEGCTCREPVDQGQFLNGVLGIQDGRSTVFRMGFTATLEVYNPNIVGTETEPGLFVLLYKGAKIGDAYSRALSIGPHGTASDRVHITVGGVERKVAASMLQEVLQRQNQMSFRFEGQALAKTWKQTVACHAHCDVAADVSHRPLPEFMQQDCTYSYDTS